MTLHVAMEQVLRGQGCPMSSRELAAEIARRGLYRRRDGSEVSPGQVSARRARYQELFDLRDGLIRLRG